MVRRPHSRKARRALLEQLEDALELPVLAVCSGTRGYAIANLDEHAARAFIEMLRRNVEDDEVALLLIGEGGYPVFADSVVRTLAQRGMDATAVVPHRVAGVFTNVALACDRIYLHEHGSLGAYDQSLLGRQLTELDAATLEAWRELPDAVKTLGPRSFEIARDRHLGRLHARLLERILSRSKSEISQDLEGALSSARLGDQLSLGAGELQALGLEATTVEEHQELVWTIYETYEELFELRDKQEPLFTESDVGDEVEFEPARGVVGAVIEGARAELVYQLDTGRPDPDTGMLEGEWLWSSLSGGRG
ncbi:MAG: SDH family Clp fold serine proteinase [Myxococcota bacterium]